MSQEKSPAKRKFEEALRYTMDLINFPDKKYIFEIRGESTVSLYEEALSLGLTGRDEIECHARLGGVFFLKGQCFEGLDKVFDEGLYSTPFYHRYVTEMEKALKLDAQRGDEFFRYAEDRNALLAPLALLWVADSKFIKKRDRYGHLSAISYLDAKVRLLDYLGGSYFPTLFFELGSLYAEIAKVSARDQLGNGEKAIEWFKRAANAEVATDIFSAFDIKRRAQKELETMLFLSQMRTSGKSGCFIATAVYGRADAPELETFRRFRDEFLLKRSMGKLFMSFYYSFSPHAAELIKKSEYAKKLVRAVILKTALRLIRFIMN